MGGHFGCHTHLAMVDHQKLAGWERVWLVMALTQSQQRVTAIRPVRAVLGLLTVEKHLQGEFLPCTMEASTGLAAMVGQ